MTSIAPQLREYQHEGSYFLITHSRAILGDDMGLGKTAQAIDAIKAIQFVQEGQFLIVCPAGLRLNWKAELKFWYPEAKVQILGAAGVMMPLPSFDICIVSYNMLPDFYAELRQNKWLGVVCDEGHYMQSLDSQRTINIRGGWGKAPIPTDRKWVLTGTPLQNRPINLYPMLKWLECDFAEKEAVFGARYCGGESQGFRGATNIAELNEKLKTVMLRRTKEQVLGELPPKTRQVIELDFSGPAKQRAQAAEQKILAEENIEATFEQIVESLERPEINLLDKGVIARLRKSTGIFKIEAAVAFIKESLESVNKVLVFAHHREIIEELAHRVGVTSVVVQGGMSDTERHARVNIFQSDPDVRVFYGNIEAAGVGLTLTAASLVIFVEQDWTPGKNVQAEDRVHRIGQKENVLVQYLVVSGTLDAVIARSNIRKQAVLDEVLA